MELEMYIPISLGIMTLFSLLAVVIGQIVTLFKVHNIEKTRHCGMMGIGAAAGVTAAAAASKAGWLKPIWDFGKLVIDKVKDKFKDKAAEKIADKTADHVEETIVAPEQVKK